jgi:hypothetical protein
MENKIISSPLKRVRFKKEAEVPRSNITDFRTFIHKNIFFAGKTLALKAFSIDAGLYPLNERRKSDENLRII